MFSLIYPKLQKHLENSQKKSIQEKILQLEEELKQIYSIEVDIILIKKKHASGKIKHIFENYRPCEIIELRISNSLNYSTILKISHELCSKLLKKRNITTNSSTQLIEDSDKIKPHNTTAHFIEAIKNQYFYVYEYLIKITTNSTSQTCRLIKNNLHFQELQISIPKQIFEKIIKQTLMIDEIKKYEKKIAKLLCEHFKTIIITKVQECNSTSLNSTLKTINCNYTSTKWGHCTSKNDIMIHISLLNAPKEILEYVIYHELAHTVVKNHSSAYWKVCNSLTPHTKKARNYLKSTPPTLFASKKQIFL